MHTIRPHKILQLVQDVSRSRIGSIYIHPKAPNMLETVIQISLLKILKPWYVFSLPALRLAFEDCSVPSVPMLPVSS